MRFSIFALFLVACFPPPKPWSVRYRALNAANPVQAVKKLYIDKADYSQTQVHGKSIDAFAATLNPKRAASFRADVVAVGEKFNEQIHSLVAQSPADAIELVNAPAPDAFTARLVVYSLELGDGWSAGGIDASGNDAKLNCLIETRAPNGQSESYDLTTQMGGGYGSGDRLRAVGILAANDYVRYLRLRKKGLQQEPTAP